MNPSPLFPNKASISSCFMHSDAFRERYLEVLNAEPHMMKILLFGKFGEWVSNHKPTRLSIEERSKVMDDCSTFAYNPEMAYDLYLPQGVTHDI